MSNENEAPAATPPRPGRGRAVAALVVVAVAGVWWAAGGGKPPVPPAPEVAAADLEDVADEPSTAANPGYLGPQACAPCHAARVAEFLQTAHARACRAPTNGPMPAGFAAGKGTFTTPDRAVRFDLVQRGTEFYQTGTQTGPGGDRRATNRIDLVYGANKADEVFFTWQGNRLAELMTVWLHPTNEWATAPYDPHGGGAFARPSDTRCLECHNTWAEHVRGTPDEYRPDSFVLGVTCENCHGPGRPHADHHRQSPKTPAHAIVHPGRLPRDRQIEVCTQCHGNANKLRGPMFSYRPGEPLAAHFRTAHSQYREQDHVANQVKYLAQSKCFTKSEMTCATCHDPHRPHAPADKAAAGNSCAKCHQPADCKDQPRLPAAVRGQCVECHMPQRVWMNVHFHTPADQYVPPVRRWDHRIAVHPVARSEVLLAWHRAQPADGDKREADRLAGELAAHWLEEVEKRRREYRFLAAIGAAREALRLDPAPPLREKAAAVLRECVAVQTKLDADFVGALHDAGAGRVPAAIQRLNEILVVKPDWAAVHGKLGTLYAKTGQAAKAAAHLEQVVTFDPDDATGLIVTAELALNAGRPDEAAALYQRVFEIEPFDATTEYHWGLSLLRLRRWPDAAERFRRVNVIAPRHPGGYQGLSHALRETGKADEALLPARRAAKLTEYRNFDVLLTLAETLAATGRAAEAATAAAKALDLDAGFDVAIRRRLEAIRSKGGR